MRAAGVTKAFARGMLAVPLARTSTGFFVGAVVVGFLLFFALHLLSVCISVRCGVRDVCLHASACMRCIVRVVGGYNNRSCMRTFHRILVGMRD